MGMFDGIGSFISDALPTVGNMFLASEGIPPLIPNWDADQGGFGVPSITSNGTKDDFSPASLFPSAIGAVGSYLGAQQTNKASAFQADKQMAFQQQMSNTAHQREVQDLIAAGLNPMLSAKLGGASSPSGAMAPVQNALGQATTTASQNYQLHNQARLINAQEKATLEQADLSRTQTLVELAKMPGHELYRDQIKALIGMQVANTEFSAQSARHQRALADLAEKGISPSSDPFWYRDFKRILEKSINGANPLANPFLRRADEFTKGLGIK